MDDENDLAFLQEFEEPAPEPPPAPPPAPVKLPNVQEPRVFTFTEHWAEIHELQAKNDRLNNRYRDVLYERLPRAIRNTAVITSGIWVLLFGITAAVYAHIQANEVPQQVAAKPIPNILDQVEFDNATGLGCKRDKDCGSKGYCKIKIDDSPKVVTYCVKR